MTKDHKFFERYLDNDLEEIKVYLDKKLDDIVDGKLFYIDKSKEASGNPGWTGDGNPWSRQNGASTQLLEKYNLFHDDFEPFNKLKNALKEMTQEACEYYGVDFEAQNYQTMSWFNYDYGKHKYQIKDLHDHYDGHGAPDFHGYYCIDAEPSVTHYRLFKDPEKMFENINKNNRAVVSETGHPHTRGDWEKETPRITIAYDIVPFKNNMGDNYVNL